MQHASHADACLGVASTASGLCTRTRPCGILSTSRAFSHEQSDLQHGTPPFDAGGCQTSSMEARRTKRYFETIAQSRQSSRVFQAFDARLGTRPEWNQHMTPCTLNGTCEATNTRCFPCHAHTLLDRLRTEADQRPQNESHAALWCANVHTYAHAHDC